LASHLKISTPRELCTWPGRQRLLSFGNSKTVERMEAGQNALISQQERIVAHMDSTDRHACEEQLRAELHGVYGKLEPQARRLLLAAEQIYRVPGFAAPAQIVHLLSTAFEIQVWCSVISPLLAFQDSKDEKPSKPVSLSHDRPKKFTLGGMKQRLRGSEPAIDEFFDLACLNRADIREALATVLGPRNEAAHGRPIDVGTAEAIRNDWLHWGGKSGGIFAVLFRPE